jgi:hypothetical protein
MRIYDLPPAGGAKSFYGKAKVIINDDKSEVLVSYETPVLRKTPEGYYVRLTDRWSATTGRHIKAYSGLNKDYFFSLPRKK